MIGISKKNYESDAKKRMKKINLRQLARNTFPFGDPTSCGILQRGEQNERQLSAAENRIINLTGGFVPNN